MNQKTSTNGPFAALRDDPAAAYVALDAAAAELAPVMAPDDLAAYAGKLASHPCYASMAAVKTFSMVHTDALMLLRFFALAAMGPVLEIGPYVGGTSVAIAQGLKQAGPGAGPLISIELGGAYAHDLIPSADIHADWQINMTRFGVADSAVLVAGNSTDMNVWRRVEALAAGRPISMIFMDADGGVRRDFLFYRALIAPGAIVVCDDYKSYATNSHKSDRVSRGVDALVHADHLEHLGVYGWGTWFGRVPRASRGCHFLHRRWISLQDHARRVIETRSSFRRM